MTAHKQADRRDAGKPPLNPEPREGSPRIYSRFDSRQKKYTSFEPKGPGKGDPHLRRTWTGSDVPARSETFIS